MIYEYSVQPLGTAVFDNLEAMGSQLQDVLNSSEEESNSETGWELWQTEALHDGRGLSGFLLIYRRPKS